MFNQTDFIETVQQGTDKLVALLKPNILSVLHGANTYSCIATTECHLTDTQLHLKSSCTGDSVASTATA
jgi:hypothetical protein